MQLLWNTFDIGLRIGIHMLSAVVALALYVFESLAHMRALNVLGYNNSWLAWIPYGQYYACADAVSDNQENVYLFNKYSVPSAIFKLWWLLPIAISFLLDGKWVSFINTAIRIIFLGAAYTKMYARLEYKSENETQVIGCLSGFMSIIASFKFIKYV